MTQADTARLREALNVLAMGSPSRFEDLMWLGFGDDWLPMVDRLVRGGYVRLNGRERTQPQLTDRGRAFIDQVSAMAGAGPASPRIAG